MSKTSIEAWHFVGDTLRDGRAVPADGVTLVHEGPLVVCESGLHASERAIDALRYAPGATACWVLCGGETVRAGDKLVCRERTILWRVDATEVLRAWARRCALDVIHLWDAPNVVREYLETGDESLRATASATTAWATARAAARAAAWAAQNDRLTEMLMAAHAARGEGAEDV